VITPDGCAVDLYRVLPAMGEPEIVHGAIPAGAGILELGAGAGRVPACAEHPVVAVDESAEMLAWVRGAGTVLAKIQNLRLHRRVDVVLLASFLVNVPDRALRQRFLTTCRDHVREGGCVVVQRHSPGWFDEAADG
jgi:spermidine synthase